jgi:hypothetical protein
MTPKFPKPTPTWQRPYKNFDELYTQYQKLGGTVNYQDQINAK